MGTRPTRLPNARCGYTLCARAPGPQGHPTRTTGGAAGYYRAHVTTAESPAGDRDAPTLHGPQCQCRNAATGPPRRGTLRTKSSAIYDTNEVGQTRHDPTLRAPGRVTKRRIGGRRSLTIVRPRRGKDLDGIGQGSANSPTRAPVALPGCPYRHFTTTVTVNLPLPPVQRSASPHEVREALTVVFPFAIAVNLRLAVPHPPPGTQAFN